MNSIFITLNYPTRFLKHKTIRNLSPLHFYD